MIERDFDIPFVSKLALQEKQVQQNYRPIIAVHKWFARRPGTLFRSLVLSEFAKTPLSESYYKSHDLKGISIADPFMGGGIPLIEANRLGCDVLGFDINPMAYWIVRQEIEHLDLDKYKKSSIDIKTGLEKKIGDFYKTTCKICSSPEAYVKYFLWVTIQACDNCKKENDLFPGYLIAEDVRHPKNVLVCPKCGELCEVIDLKNLGKCSGCSALLVLDGPAKRSKCSCRYCGKEIKFPDAKKGPPRQRMFAIEYYCTQCKAAHKGRFFKKPDHKDLLNYKKSEKLLKEITPKFIPSEHIPRGDETDRLLRWGYKYYKEMFNARQLLSLELTGRLIHQEKDIRIKNALATNMSDLLRYQNMLCRYDSMALKSLDIFSVHGFPVGLIQCESNFIGLANEKNVIGSGGWINITTKYLKAKQYCDNPFEIIQSKGHKVQVPILNEWIGDYRNGTKPPSKRNVRIECKNAMKLNLPKGKLDAVFTDPPYFGNVQYAELMDFCYVWLRKLITDDPAFKAISTRNEFELTENDQMGRGIEHFADGLSKVFQRMKEALKVGAPFVFTYHHNDIEAYLPIAVALLDANLVISASIPCPAEMGGSIHINGTGSSVVDTVFVCRTTGIVSKKLISDYAQDIAEMVMLDVSKLRSGEIKPTQGDVRCIIYGHLIRLAVWNLKKVWDLNSPTSEKINIVKSKIESFGGLTGIQELLSESFERLQSWKASETHTEYGEISGSIRF